MKLYNHIIFNPQFFFIMKTFILSSMMLVFGVMNLCAQAIEETAFSLTPSNTGETSVEAIKNVENTMKLPTSVDAALKNLVKKNPAWQVATLTDDNVTEPDEIEIQTKSADKTTDIVYDSKGNPIKWVEETENAPLPDAVNQAIQNQFGDWQIIKDKKVFNSTSKNMDVFVLKIQNGSHTKTIYLDEKGNFLKGV
jgi:hypothetical protein